MFIADRVMASSTSRGSSDLTQIFSVSAGEAPGLVESHGFFYSANPKIAAYVDDLYRKSSERSARKDDFKLMLQEDPVSRKWNVSLITYWS